MSASAESAIAARRCAFMPFISRPLEVLSTALPRRKFEHPMGVGDVEVACSVHRYSSLAIAGASAEWQLDLGGGTRRQFDHPVVVVVGDVDVACAVHRYTVGMVKPGERQLHLGDR